MRCPSLSAQSQGTQIRGFPWPLILATLLFVGLDSAPTQAQVATADLAPQTSSSPLVRLYAVGSTTEGGELYLIVHGLGGTRPIDRFHLLAQAIKASFPEANVVLLDWSEPASAKIGPAPNPWKVARQIDAVAEQGARLLADGRFDSTRATLIGESFGNYVNAQLATLLGGVERILAFNPANEAGGYLPPNLRTRARQAWSFHTHSVFDTANEIAHADLFLETPAGSTDWQQHVAGIRWLAERVTEGHFSWLRMEHQLPEPTAGLYLATAKWNGDLAYDSVPRIRPKLEAGVVE